MTGGVWKWLWGGRSCESLQWEEFGISCVEPSDLDAIVLIGRSVENKHWNYYNYYYAS